MAILPQIEIDPKTFLRQHCTLPALPTLVTNLQQMLQKEDTSITQVAELISSDPALVAQILKIVNSAYYSLPQEVTKINFAVAFLGLNEICRLALTLSVINTLDIAQSRELVAFWHHSFYTALCTKHLARTYMPQLPFDELWSAAILHDIGKLVYLKFFPEHYLALQAYCTEQGCLFSTAEEKLGMPSSSFFGILLCEHWLLPSKVRDACMWHSLKDIEYLQKDTSPGGDFKRMVCLGNLVAVLASDSLATEVKHQLAEAITTVLQISESQFLTLMGSIYDLRLEVEAFLKKFQ
ncbi:MAG: HDOD domain-containing protein [Desulfobacterota bacterium]|nr:HDOD domain-containing protein [Thermodesulfobacteriota bacterium]